MKLLRKGGHRNIFQRGFDKQVSITKEEVEPITNGVQDAQRKRAFNYRLLMRVFTAAIVIVVFIVMFLYFDLGNLVEIIK